ncbi:MAG TPA: MoxR family ATPase, partial [Phycisphaerae bacterium]|nr:MoxR family ATPase [Phycisphaerae bacterium]
MATIAPNNIEAQVADFKSRYESIESEVGKVIVGHHQVVAQTILCLMIGGHALLEGVPGLGKTMLVRTLSQVLHLQFSRIQFTPDLMPADIVGTSIVATDANGQRNWQFQPGPIFGNLILADEINRATPKTQSALLEAMEERQVTVDGTTYQLARPFIVLATQNPIEYEGTFPLPEAQLDRFLLRIRLGYPNTADEVRILDAQQYNHPVDSVEQVVSLEELLAAQAEIKKVYVENDLRRYMVDVVSATRSHEDVYLGASPRGSLALFRAAQAKAALAG